MEGGRALPEMARRACPKLAPGESPGFVPTATTPRRGGTILMRMNRSEDQQNVIDVPCTANLESFCGPRTFIPPPRLGVPAGISRLVAPLPPHVVSSIYSQGNASGDGRRRERTVRDTRRLRRASLSGRFLRIYKKTVAFTVFISTIHSNASEQRAEIPADWADLARRGRAALPADR